MACIVSPRSNIDFLSVSYFSEWPKLKVNLQPMTKCQYTKPTYIVCFGGIYFTPCLKKWKHIDFCSVQNKRLCRRAAVVTWIMKKYAFGSDKWDSLILFTASTPCHLQHAACSAGRIQPSVKVKCRRQADMCVSVCMYSRSVGVCPELNPFGR